LKHKARELRSALGQEALLHTGCRNPVSAHSAEGWHEEFVALDTYGASLQDSNGRETPWQGVSLKG
jgi:hypothetical protein